MSVSWGSDEAAEEGLPQSSPKGQMHLGRVARDRARGPGLGGAPASLRVLLEARSLSD